MRQNLTKKEIVNSIYMQLGFSKKLIENLLEDIFEVLFDSLKQNGIRRVVMAGSIARPHLEESKMDEYTLNLMPKLLSKLVQGDNKLLSFIAGEFEKKGYQILGASELIPDLTVGSGFLCGSSYESLNRDIFKADSVLKALSPEDIGQGIVIENGLVLGIETI